MESVLRKLSFIVVIIGIAFLLGMLIFSFSPYEEIESAEDLDGLEVNEKGILRGVVEQERKFDDFVLLNIGDVEVFCDVCKDKELLGKELIAYGFVDEFNDKRQFNVLRVFVLE